MTFTWSRKQGRGCVGAAALMLAGIFGFAAPVEARDKITFPFTCSIDNGRLRVTPSSDHSYPIVAGRGEQQVFTFCPAGEGRRCRSWTVHRFAVQCSGGKATWPEIVAAAARQLQSRAHIEEGQLVLPLGPGAPRAGGDCVETGRPTLRPVAGMIPCRVQLAAARPLGARYVALPRGYAPLSVIGARIVSEPDFVKLDNAPVKLEELAAPAKSETVTMRTDEAVARLEPRPQGTVKPDPAPMAASAPLPTEVASAARGPSMESTGSLPSLADPALPRGLAKAMVSEQLDAVVPLPASAPLQSTAVLLGPFNPRSLAPLPTVEPASWKPQGSAAPSTVMAARDELAAGERNAGFVLLLAAATVLLLATTVLARRRQPALRPQSSQSDPADGERALVLRSKAEGNVVQITEALGRLTSVAPLRAALSRDLQASERRLAVVIAATSSDGLGADGWSRARRRLERINQDLDRLQMITDGALTSLSGLRASRGLPRNVEEAYAALGVTSGVSEPILKKLVEALRVSWHPDLGKSDEEREARNGRITEINVAWDLITGKRRSE